MANSGPRSGLIIEVPEAEPAVRYHRERLDASAPLGVPAHITVLFPFMPPQAIDAGALARLDELFADAGRFEFELDRTSWFGADVLWLAPRDSRPFRALTECVFRAFPAFLPFEGQFEEVVPHLTIGHGHPVQDLRAAEDSVQAHLPVRASAAAITLIAQRSAGGHWTSVATFTLG
jgi:2'-5' RNA ligase